MSVHIWETVQKARHQHFCDYCCEWIVPGSTYARWLWKAGGRSFLVMRQHRDPGCVLDTYGMEESACAFPITYRLALKSVELVQRDGRVITEYHSRLVPVLEEPEPEPYEHVDVPF
jgi:hypothetical protein